MHWGSLETGIIRTMLMFHEQIFGRLSTLLWIVCNNIECIFGLGLIYLEDGVKINVSYVNFVRQ